MNKFRVWCNDFNEWEKDLCLLDHEGNLHHFVRLGMMIPVKKESHIVEFYIGLTDKNKKMIFAGDVLLDNVGRKWIVKYLGHKATFIFAWEKDQRQYQTFSRFNHAQKPLEIIGNIHEATK